MELYWNLQKCISGFFSSAFEFISQQTLVFMKTSSRRLDQDRYIRITHTSSENVLKTSWRRLDQGKYILLGHTSSKRLQDIFKTSCKNVFKTSTRHLEDVFGTYSKHFWDVLQRRLSIEGFAYVTLLRNLWSVYKICKSDKSFSNFSFSLC